MPDEGQPPESKDEGKTFTQDDVDRIVADRLKREQSKHSDYADLKAKASRLDELEAVNKSDLDKATERIAEAEKRAAAAQARADRFEVALDKGLDMVRAKRLTGTTREELEADADELTTWTTAGKDDKPVPGKPTADLKGGGDPTEEPEVDVRKVVESIPRGF